MKFLKLIEELQAKEENKGKVVIARCGVFMTAIGKDAIFLNKVLGINLTCLKPGICKTGIPLNSIFKYMNSLENLGYAYSVYDYDKDTKNIVLKYTFNGAENIETNKCQECEKCKYYKKYGAINNMNIFELMDERNWRKNEE